MRRYGEDGFWVNLAASSGFGNGQDRRRAAPDGIRLKLSWAAALAGRGGAAAITGLQLDLFGNGERVVHFDAEVTDRAFQLCVPEE